MPKPQQTDIVSEARELTPANAVTITSLARQVNEIYGTDLTEKLLEVATSAEQRLEELQTCQLCDAVAAYGYCRKHR